MVSDDKVKLPNEIHESVLRHLVFKYDLKPSTAQKLIANFVAEIDALVSKNEVFKN